MDTREITDCPNCGTKLKDSLIGGVALLSENKTRIINEYHDKKAKGYCNKCGKELYAKYKVMVDSEHSKISAQIQPLISAIPVISLQNPANWDYEVLEMVTGQSTTGTGVVSEFTSSFTDMLGRQSGRYNRKIKGGESICFSQLRLQTLNLGGNAVIAADIDYSEVGGEKGMLMVCMAGTAIRLKNLEILGEQKADAIQELCSLKERLNTLNQHDTQEF